MSSKKRFKRKHNGKCLKICAYPNCERLFFWDHLKKNYCSDSHKTRTSYLRTHKDAKQKNVICTLQYNGKSHSNHPEILAADFYRYLKSKKIKQSLIEKLCRTIIQNSGTRLLFDEKKLILEKKITLVPPVGIRSVKDIVNESRRDVDAAIGLGKILLSKK